MGELVGKKVVILEGLNAGSEGIVAYEDQDAVAIAAPPFAGDLSWYGYWYARKQNVKEV